MASFPTFDSDSTANKLKQSYFQGATGATGFLDLNNCDIYVRGGKGIHLDSGVITYGNPITQTLNNTTVSYISDLTSSAQTQINNSNNNISTLLNNTVNISNSTGLTSGTTIITGLLSLTGNLLVNSKTITPTNLSLLNNLSQNVQVQLNQINNTITNISNPSGVSTVINNNLQITGTSPFIQINSSSSGAGSFIINPISAGTSVSSIQISTSPSASVFNTYQQANDAVIQASNSTTGGNLMICSGTTNGLRLTSSQLQVYCNLYANSLTITPTQLGYLSTLTSPFNSDLQTQINSINTTLTNISYSSGITTINNAITSNNNIQTTGGNFYVSGSGLSNGYNSTNTNGSTVTKLFIGNVQTAGTLNTNQQLNDCVINITNGSTAGGSLLICSGTSSNSTGVRFTPTQMQLYMPLYVNSTSISTTQLSYLNALTSPFSSDPQTQINTINGTLSNISNTNGTTSGATVLANTVRFSGTTTFQGVSTLNLNGPVSVTGNITANALTVNPTNLGNVSGLTDLPVIVSTAQTVGGIKTFTGACVFSNAGAGVSFTGTAPTMSGANITSGSIPSTSVNLSSVALTGNLTLNTTSYTAPTFPTQIGSIYYSILSSVFSAPSATYNTLGNTLGVTLQKGNYMCVVKVVLQVSSSASPVALTNMLFGISSSSSGISSDALYDYTGSKSLAYVSGGNYYVFTSTFFYTNTSTSTVLYQFATPTYSTGNTPNYYSTVSQNQSCQLYVTRLG